MKNSKGHLLENQKADFQEASPAKKRGGLFYNGTKLLNMKDLDGKRPEIFLCTTNRSAGKTTFFSKMLVDGFLEKGEKFCLLYRFNNELDDVANAFFRDIGGLFYPGVIMSSKRMAAGSYHELFLNDIECGYAIALNSADKLKRFSHLLSDSKWLFFDEFQSETEHYCPHEIDKFLSVHTSIARGGGSQSRYLPCILCGNNVSILNPYFVALGISDRLRSNTKFLRGNGFVLESGFLESAANAIAESRFNIAFGNQKYQEYAMQNVYLNDNMAFIERPSGKSIYFCTVRSDGKNFAIREYPELGIVYCDTKYDESYPIRIAVTTEDHQINYVMLKRNEMFIEHLRYLFDHGSFRFRNLEAKNAVLKLLCYY